MKDRYDWIDGTYDIAKYGERLLIDDVIEMLYERDTLRADNERLTAALREIIESSDNWRDCQAALAHIQDTAKEALGDES